MGKSISSGKNNVLTQILLFVSMLMLFSVSSSALPVSWELEFVLPTPSDGAILSEHSVNVTVKGHTNAVTEDVSINNAWIDFNGANKSMSGSGFSWSYVNTTLLVGSYTYKVYVNDTFGNVNATETRTFSVPSYNITFNVTDADNGQLIDNIANITCSYSGFDRAGDIFNPYGPYTFPIGSWQCTFSKPVGTPKYWDETITFVADANKNISFTMSSQGGLSYEEHSMLDWVYRCLKYSECNAYNLWNSTYQNVSRIWQEFIPTNISVVANETFISKILSPTSNITIDYKVNLPYKKGVEDKALLPIRIFYWFTNTSGACFNQNKQADSNTAETPFCIPLMAEYLGPNNGSTSFRVELDPTLPDGTYEVVRQIDIDPPLNGVQTWINYGREKIGSIVIVNPVKADISPEIESALPDVVQAKAPKLSNMDMITGASIISSNEPIKYIGGFIILGLTIICVTIISGIYIRSRYK